MNEKAFPQRINDDSGMDMRDYFAAKIATAMYSEMVGEDNIDWDFDSIASSAYAFADAMIKERNK